MKLKGGMSFAAAGQTASCKCKTSLGHKQTPNDPCLGTSGFVASQRSEGNVERSRSAQQKNPKTESIKLY